MSGFFKFIGRFYNTDIGNTTLGMGKLTQI